ncbi:hypothetical protein FQN57_005181 [Myotisia sp. PD_48]|nr:hypothetical protein FQN57_005181 [Myotisia sp. PD_48]
MPLVVPDISESDQQAWVNKLMGKKLTDSTTNETCFAKTELPETHRILKPGDFGTMDFVPNRLNVYIDEQNTVTNVKHG